MGTRVDKVAEQEAAVAKFLEEHQPLLKEPELSFAVLEATYVQGAEFLKSLSDELKRREGPAVEATNALTDALNERPRVAPKIAKCEKTQKRLRGDFYRVNSAFERLEVFIAEVKARLDTEYDEDGNRITDLPNAQQMRRIGEEEGRKMTEGMLEELSKRPAVPSPVRSAKETPDLWRVSYFKTIKEPTRPAPWWKRIFGIKEVPNNWIGSIPSTAPSEDPRSVRESPVTPSQAISEGEDYEKLLTWYEQNLEVLERAVAGRQAGEPGDWSQVIDELLGRMAWCDRHMDTIEQRNADMAGSELVERREGLASRRAELGE